jgi:hypothetical protein
MKTLRSFADIPPHAKFIGASWHDGFIAPSIQDEIERAIEPAQVRAPDGSTLYFELAREIE